MKLWIRILGAVFSAASLYAAAGIEQTIERLGPVDNPTETYAITITWTAAANGTVPSKVLLRTGLGMANSDGRAIVSVVTRPGSPAPTDNYSVYFIDERGADIMSGACVNRDTTSTESCNADPIPLYGTVTIVISGNSVNAATGQIVVYLVRQVVAKRGGSGSGGLSLSDFASEAQCEAGTEAAKVASPLCVAQAVATQARLGLAPSVTSGTVGSLSAGAWANGETSVSVGTLTLTKATLNITSIGTGAVTTTLNLSGNINARFLAHEMLTIAGAANCPPLNATFEIQSIVDADSVTITANTSSGCGSYTSNSGVLGNGSGTGSVLAAGNSNGSVLFAVSSGLGMFFTFTEASNRYSYVQEATPTFHGEPLATFNFVSGVLTSVVYEATAFRDPNITCGDGVTCPKTGTGQVIAVASDVCRSSGGPTCAGGWDPMDPTVQYIIDDFSEQSSTSKAGFALLDTNCTRTWSDGEAGYSGMHVLTTAASTNDACGFKVQDGSGSNNFFNDIATITNKPLVIRFKTPASLTNWAFYFGYGNFGGFAYEQALIVKLASDTNFFCENTTSNVANRANTTVAVATSTWYTLKIDFTTAGTTRCTINGTLTTNSNNFPSGGQSPWLYSTNSGATAHAIKLDYFGLKY